MKNLKALLLLSLLWFAATTIQAQKTSLTVVNFDVQGMDLSPEQMGNLARMEVEKLGLYEVMDRYDVSYLVDKHQLELNNCYGKICLMEIGDLIKTDKIMSGSAEVFGQSIILTIRLVDVKKGVIEKAHVREYLLLPHEIRTIMEVSIREMHELENDPNLVAQLTREDQHENKIINPDVERLKLSGPRFGFTFFSGDAADVISANTEDGGYNARPHLMYMLGYQFEIQYLNAGKMQALFEIIPTITGAEQSLFFPSVNVLHGLRHNVSGWEFAVGLSLGVAPQAKGYLTEQGDWILQEDWPTTQEPPAPLIQRLDRRGDLELNTGLVIAAGKSFKSGRMNIPVNVFVVPSPFGMRYGISVGFNAVK